MEETMMLYGLGALAVAGASRILGKAVDAGAHRELVDQLAAEL